MICKYCGSKLDDKCETCPNCGAHNNVAAAKNETKIVSDLSGNSVQTNPLGTVNGKNKLLAALLAMIFGGVGAHHFYFKHYGEGILCILFAWTCIPSIIGVIQGLIILLESDKKFLERFY